MGHNDRGKVTLCLKFDQWTFVLKKKTNKQKEKEKREYSHQPMSWEIHCNNSPRNGL